MRMLLAELSAGEWGAIITAIGGAAGTLIAAIFAGIKYLKVVDSDTQLKLEKVKAATAKLAITKQAKDQDETIRHQAKEIEDSRKEVHDWRDKAHAYEMKIAAYDERFKLLEKRQAEIEERHHSEKQDIYRRLQECEDDRNKLWDALHGNQHPPQR
jgi:chromosome segregation ATPase